MAQISAYLHFSGECREAMTFYQGCFGGKLEQQSVGESPMAGQMPAETHKKILHASLRNGHVALMASDLTGPEGVKPGSVISLAIMCESPKELDTLFSKLSVGGKVQHALKEEFFGTYGDLMDKYGINWMLNYDKNARP